MRFHFVCLTVGLGFASHAGFAAQHDHPGQAADPATAQVAQCGQAQSVVNGLVEAALERVEAARLTNNPTAMRDAVDDLGAVLVDIREQLSPCSQLTASAAAGHAGHTMPNVEPGSASTPGPPPAQPGSPAPAPRAVEPPAPARIDPHAGHTSAPAPRETTPRSPSSSAPTSAAPAAHDGHAESPPPAAAGSAGTARAGRLPPPPTDIGTLKCRTRVDPKTAPRMLHGARMYYFCTEEERAAFARDPSKYGLPTEPASPTHAH